MPFSDRNISTMIHGVFLGGGALLALSAALFALRAMPAAPEPAIARQQGRPLSLLLIAVAVLTWLAVLGGTFLVFPLYRIPPAEGLTDLSAHPRALLLSRPETAWLHRFAMEIKEHAPWIVAMLTTAAAFVGVRYPSRLLADRQLRGMVTMLTAISFALVSVVALLGVLINKVAPLE